MNSQILQYTFPLSIVTTTYNAEKCLPRLVASLNNQTDKDFDWVVVDGASNDRTLEILHAAKSEIRNLVVVSRKDCGIYDAMNCGISMCRGDFYLAVGADDRLEANAILDFKSAIAREKADLITAKVWVDGRIHQNRKPSWVWFYGASSKVSHHSVGTAIKKSLHKEFGSYDLSYSIYADGDFMLKAIKGGAAVFQESFIAGEFSTHGISNNSPIISFSEQLRSQIRNDSNWVIQLFLFTIRMIKMGLLGRLK